MKLIPLTQGQFAKVDDEDFEKFGHLKWAAAWSKEKKNYYAIKTAYKPIRRTMRLHREIMANPLGMLVDHINHDPLDCQKSNLRIATPHQNAANRRGPTRRSSTGIRGVYRRDGRGLWVAMIRVNGDLIGLGSYRTSNDAAIAYAAANRKYFGEFGGGL